MTKTTTGGKDHRPRPRCRVCHRPVKAAASLALTVGPCCLSGMHPDERRRLIRAARDAAAAVDVGQVLTAWDLDEPLDFDDTEGRAA